MSDLERQIANGLREANRQAWLRLYDLYSQRVWHLVARMMGGDEADIADVVQEIFLAAAESAKNFKEGRGGIWLWLVGIARRQVALHYRRKSFRADGAQRWWKSLNGVAEEWLAGKGAAPPEMLEADELGRLVRTALLELPADYQVLLVGKYLDDASAEQMAEELQISAEAVRAKLMRARKAFKKSFMKVARGSSGSRGVADLFGLLGRKGHEDAT